MTSRIKCQVVACGRPAVTSFSFTVGSLQNEPMRVCWYACDGCSKQMGYRSIVRKRKSGKR